MRRSEKKCIKKCILFRNFKHKVHTRRQTNYLSKKIESQGKENMISHTIFLFVTNQEALMSRIWDTSWNGLKVTYLLKKLKTKNAWRRNQQTSVFSFLSKKYYVDH